MKTKIKTFKFTISESLTKIETKINDFMEGKEVISVAQSTILIGFENFILVTVLYKSEE